MRVFIAYSRKDRRFVDRLAADLREAGVPVWRDVDDIPTDVAANTVSWRNAVDHALRECTHMIVVISPDSVASPEVQAEWNYFLSQGRPVYPLLIRDAEIPYRLYTLQIWDFRQNYHDMLEQLIRILPVGEAPVEAPPDHEDARERLTHVVHSLTEEVRTRPMLSAALGVILVAAFALVLAIQIGYIDLPVRPTPSATPVLSPTPTPPLEPDQILGPISVDSERYSFGEPVTVRVRRGRSVSTVLCIRERTVTNRSDNLGAPTTITPVDENTFEDVYTFIPEVVGTYVVRCSGVVTTEQGTLRVTADPAEFSVSFVIADLLPSQRMKTLSIDRTTQHEVNDTITVRLVRGVDVASVTCSWVRHESSESGTLALESSTLLDEETLEAVYTFTPTVPGTYTVRCQGIVSLEDSTRVIGTGDSSFYVSKELTPAEQLGPISVDGQDHQVGDLITVRLRRGAQVSDLTCSWSVQDTDESSEWGRVASFQANEDQFVDIYLLQPEIAGRYVVNCSGVAATSEGEIPVSVTLPFDVREADEAG